MCRQANITISFKSGGHQGVTKTHLTIGDNFFILGLIHHLRSYIKGCGICDLSRNDKPPVI